MGTFDNIYGHAGYIRYLYDNGHLPDFDPLSRSQHYQPPLHHALCALWMRLNTAFLGLSLNQAAESHCRFSPCFIPPPVCWWATGCCGNWS